MQQSMANLLGNPAVIGAVTGVVAYFLLEEVLDDYIDDFMDMVKGKKKGNKSKNAQRKSQGLGGYTPPPSPLVPPQMNAYYTNSFATTSDDLVSGWWQYQ